MKHEAPPTFPSGELILITNKTVDKKSSHNPYMQDYAMIFCTVFNWFLVLFYFTAICAFSLFLYLSLRLSVISAINSLFVGLPLPTLTV